MKVITASELRANLAASFDAIENDAEDLVVTRSGHEPMVVMLKSDYDAWHGREYLSRGAVATTTGIGEPLSAPARPSARR